MTLWAAVVAHRLGFKWHEALTLGRAVAGLNAHSKGVSLGIFEPTPKAVAEQRKKLHEKFPRVSLLGRAVPVKATADGMRAVSNDRPISASSVKSYLQRAFGDDLDDVQAAMTRLAKSMPPQKLAQEAYDLYVKFRPRVLEGAAGWGARGSFRLSELDALARA